MASRGGPHRRSAAGLTNTAPRLAGCRTGGWLSATARATVRSSRWASSPPRRSTLTCRHALSRRIRAAVAGWLLCRSPRRGAGEFDSGWSPLQADPQRALLASPTAHLGHTPSHDSDDERVVISDKHRGCQHQHAQHRTPPHCSTPSRRRTRRTTTTNVAHITPPLHTVNTHHKQQGFLPRSGGVRGGGVCPPCGVCCRR